MAWKCAYQENRRTLVLEHLPHHRTIGADDGTNCDSCKGKASYSNHQTFSKLYTSCYITLIQLRVRMFPLLYLKARRSSTSCSKILAETSEKSKIIQNITIEFNGNEIMSCLLRSGCSHSANILLGRYLRRGFFFVRTVLILIQIRPTEIDIKSLQWREVAF